MSETVPRPERVECSECGQTMAGFRTGVRAVAWLFRYECVACPGTGTVEVRVEESITADAPRRRVPRGRDTPGETMTRRVWPEPSPSTGWRAVYDAMSVPQPDLDVLAIVPDRHGVIA
jgi:hypothetical protein